MIKKLGRNDHCWCGSGKKYKACHEALRKNNVKFEYHVFPDGCHGLGLGTKETATKGGKHYQPEVYEWTKLFEQWMNRMA